MERQYVSIYFPYLVTDWICWRSPALRTERLVCCTQQQGRKIITAVNPIAHQQGIYPGMLLADARAIYPALVNKDASPHDIHQLLERIAHWCIRFSPITATDQPQGICIDATGCSHLWGGNSQYIHALLTRLHQKGFAASAAMAPTIGAAWALARYGKEQHIISTTELKDAIAALPVNALRIDTPLQEKLHKLGLTTIGQLLSMPAAALRKRFGAVLIERLQQITGQCIEQCSPIRPLVEYTERLPCLEPIQQASGIQIAMLQLVEKLCKRLQQLGKGIRKASLHCYKIDQQTASISISTQSATVHTRHLLHLLELQLPQLAAEPGIELFELCAETVEDYQPPQASIWQDHQQQSNIALHQLMDRIAGKLGAQVVQQAIPAAHHWPERSFQLQQSLTAPAPWTNVPLRPILLLPEPEPITVTAPIPDYPPMLFRYKGALHYITRADGPERIEQEWWIQEGAHRDYYQLEDEKGTRFWVFRSGHYDASNQFAWFIHGYFA